MIGNALWYLLCTSKEISNQTNDLFISSSQKLMDHGECFVEPEDLSQYVAEKWEGLYMSYFAWLNQ